MTPSKTLAPFLAAALAACAFCACSRPDQSHSGEGGILMSMEEALSRPAELEIPGPVKIWVAEKSSEMGVYYVLSERELLEPAKQDEAAQRLVLFKGRAELRVADTIKVCDAGAYAVVPPGTEWRLKRLGPEPVVFSLLITPDIVPLTGLLRLKSP